MQQKYISHRIYEFGVPSDSIAAGGRGIHIRLFLQDHWLIPLFSAGSKCFKQEISVRVRSDLLLPTRAPFDLCLAERYGLSERSYSALLMGRMGCKWAGSKKAVHNMKKVHSESVGKHESVEELMLSAAELFHYSYKFRNQVVVIAVESPDQLLTLLPDFRVLRTSHVRAAVFVAADQTSKEQIDKCNQKGYSFKLSDSADPLERSSFAHTNWETTGIPVFSLPVESSTEEICATALDFCSSVAAVKFFFVQESDGVTINDEFLSHPPISELLDLLDSNPKCTVSVSLLRFFCQQQQLRALDIAVLGSTAGALFRELFTHRGSGTLLTGTYPNLIRTANVDDVSALSLLLTPYIQSGSILPVTEDDLVSNIEQYHVFTVNGEIVASAALRDFGVACELGKFCTLPRYQRKGRARLLALSLINRARELNKEYVFALSLEPSMWAFFLGLGFQECTYSELPELWFQRYDRSRGSHSFRLNL